MDPSFKCDVHAVHIHVSASVNRVTDWNLGGVDSRELLCLLIT